MFESLNCFSVFVTMPGTMHVCVIDLTVVYHCVTKCITPPRVELGISLNVLFNKGSTLVDISSPGSANGPFSCVLWQRNEISMLWSKQNSSGNISLFCVKISQHYWQMLAFTCCSLLKLYSPRLRFYRFNITVADTNVFWYGKCYIDLNITCRTSQHVLRNMWFMCSSTIVLLKLLDMSKM